jgi:hypothetical protein
MKFGFELEGFYRDLGVIVPPPERYPTDGFPGLVEHRSTGAKSMEDAYFEVLRGVMDKPMDFRTFEHTFTPAEKRLLRMRECRKDSLVIGNIYGKEPRALGNRTLASLQINFSYLIAAGYTRNKVSVPERYGMFDFRPIIARLDKEFACELKASNRQPGFYAVKEHCRVEYRSLPNSVFTDDITKIPALLERFANCFKGY